MKVYLKKEKNLWCVPFTSKRWHLFIRSQIIFVEARTHFDVLLLELKLKAIQYKSSSLSYHEMRSAKILSSLVLSLFSVSQPPPPSLCHIVFAYSFFYHFYYVLFHFILYFILAFICLKLLFSVAVLSVRLCAFYFILCCTVRIFVHYIFWIHMYLFMCMYLFVEMVSQ